VRHWYFVRKYKTLSRILVWCQGSRTVSWSDSDFCSVHRQDRPFINPPRSLEGGNYGSKVFAFVSLPPHNSVQSRHVDRIWGGKLLLYTLFCVALDLNVKSYSVWPHSAAPSFKFDSTQLIKNTWFYETRGFITFVAKALHWKLFSTSRIQYTTSYPTSLISILIFHFHLHLDLLNDLTSKTNIAVEHLSSLLRISVVQISVQTPAVFTHDFCSFLQFFHVHTEIIT